MKDEDKKSMKSKLLSVALATELMVPTATPSNFDTKEYLEKQVKDHIAKQELINKIANLSDELYDKEYNDYCNNEEIEINGTKYSIKDLYIEYGFIDNKKIVYLIDYHNPNIDILTGKERDKEYERRKIILLKYSDVFYDYYHDEDNTLDYYINLFEGDINYNIPETYFYNPIFKKNGK